MLHVIDITSVVIGLLVASSGGDDDIDIIIIMFTC
jgi:hypothetical protein